MMLPEFLLARIAEDEAVARRWLADIAPGVPAWSVIKATVSTSTINGRDIPPLSHDPSRALAECEAKRRIVEIADAHGTMQSVEILMHLAGPYADHPDYRQEWKP